MFGTQVGQSQWPIGSPQPVSIALEYILQKDVDTQHSENICGRKSIILGASKSAAVRTRALKRRLNAGSRQHRFFITEFLGNSVLDGCR